MTATSDHLVAHSRLDQAAVLLDAARLSTLLGREVEIVHLRIKPGHNVLVAWRETGTGEYGWTEATGDRDKVGNALRRAGRAGQEITVHSDGEVVVFSGSVWADRKLAGALSGLHRGGLRVLRYNPQRRLVAATGDGLVVRVHADSVAHLTGTSVRWQRLGIPAISMFGRANLAVSPWWGAGDLLATGSRSGSHAAGEVFARLHSAARDGAGELAPLPADPVAAASAIADVAPWMGERVRELGGRLAVLLSSSAAREPLTELHGDLSPDQILVDAAGDEIRVIDFDRAGAGPASRDVGSYLAFCRQAGLTGLGEAFLAGYHAAGGAVPRVSVSVWEAYSHLTFALAPLRGGDRDWPGRVERAVELAAAALDLGPPATVEIDGESWRVNRAWADRDDALTVELTHPGTGEVRAGRWGRGGLRSFAPGEDPKLSIPAGRIVSHRAGKRAVVRSDDGQRYTKVVRTGRARGIVDGMTRAGAFSAGFRMPDVLATTGSSVTLAALEGRSLHTPGLFTAGEWDRAWAEVMTGLRRAWGTGGTEGPVHSAAMESDVLQAWVDKALAFVDTPAALLAAAESACEPLAQLPVPEFVVCHRDLHSKQLLWSPGGGPGLLDVDTACRADPALDLGNLRAHALWRQRQGVWSRRETEAVVAAIGTVPVDRVAVLAYQRATLVRLVCVYAFRPKYRTQAMALLGELSSEGHDHEHRDQGDQR